MLIKFKSPLNISQSCMTLLKRSCGYFSTNESVKVDKPKVYHEIVRSNTVSKYALQQFLNAQNLMNLNMSNDSLRVNFTNIQMEYLQNGFIKIQKMKVQQSNDLQSLENVLSESRVRPSLLLPLVQILFSSLGLASGLLGKGFSARVAIMIEKIIEEHHDDSLRILNENGIEEKALRKLICDIRDQGYDITQEIKNQKNIQVWIFALLLILLVSWNQYLFFYMNNSRIHFTPVGFL